MKNNKYAPYILGPIVLVIWGTIFYKIYQAIYGEEDLAIPTITQTFTPKDSSTTSQYQLLLNYKDPFTGKVHTSIPKNTASYQSRPSNNQNNYNVSQPKTTSNPSNNARKRPASQEKTTTPPPKTASIPLPTIKYQGFQSINGDTVALLRIDGRYFPNARLGEELRGCTINKITPDALHITFDSTRTVVRRADS